MSNKTSLIIAALGLSFSVWMTILVLTEVSQTQILITQVLAK